MGKRKTLGAPGRRKPPQGRARGGADARFQSLIRLSRSVYWESDAAHRFTLMVHGPMYVSTQAPDSQIGKTRWEIPSTQPDAAGWEAHKAALDAHLAFRDFGFARVGPDGAERQFVISGEPVFDTKGRFTGYCGIGDDVTERKQAQEALRMAEERSRSLLMASPDGIWIHRHRRVEYVNSMLVTMFGYESAEEIVGREIYEMLPPEHHEAVRVRLEQLETERRAMPLREFVMLKRDGTAFDAEVAISSFQQNDAVWIIAVIRDISERKRAERLLLLEHTVARCLADADNASEALKAVIRAVCETENWEFGRYFRVDEKAGVTRFAESWCMPGETDFIEKSREIAYGPGVGLTGKAWQSGQALWVSDIHRDTGAMQAVFTQDSGIHGAFVFPVKSEGKTIGVLVFNSRQIREPDERLLQAAGVIGIQIGQFLQRKQAEEALREAEERSRSLLMASPDGIWTHCNRRVGYVNSTLVTMLGYESAEEIAGREIYEMLPPEQHETVRAQMVQVTTERCAMPLREFVMLKRDGAALDVEVASSSFQQKDAVWIIAIIRDISERKRAQRLLLLEHTVVRCLADADSAATALKAVIRAVCETEKWECGRHFRVDEEAGALRFDEFWSVPGGVVEEFITGLSGVLIKPGVGLAGSVWQTGQPLWIADITMDDRAIQVPGIRGAFAFPVKSEGRTIGVLTFNSRQIRDPDERLLQALGVIGSQIGQFLQRKHAEQALRESEERFRSLSGLSSDRFWEQDDQYRFTSLTGVGSQLYLQTAQLIVGKRRWEQNYVNMTAADWAAHIATLEARRPFRDLELCRLDENGKKFWVSVSGEPVFDPSGTFRGYRGVGKDVSERKRDEERIQHLASHDALTSLPNRVLFSEVLNMAIQSAQRNNRRFAVLFIDLDRFKLINDTLGHQAGDKLLQEMGTRIKETLRTSDVIARLGGDEFAVLVQEVGEAAQVETVARKILSTLIKPMVISGQECRVSASIGICMYPADARDEQSLMKHADTAMYWAKQSGKNGYRFFAGESADATAQDAGA